MAIYLFFKECSDIPLSVSYPAPKQDDGKSFPIPARTGERERDGTPRRSARRRSFLKKTRMAKLTGDNRFPLDSLPVYRKSHSRFLGDFAVLQSALPSLKKR
jgi:hypothetical protein